jgi:phospholipid-binding lipoprotein MlaA
MTLRRPETVGNSNDMKPLAWAVIALAILAVGCAVSEKSPSSNRIELPSDKSAEPSADDDFGLLEEELAEQVIEVADPLEPLNRVMYHVNDTLYFWVLKPVTQVYKNIAPEPVRNSIRDFFHNLTTPIRFANCLVQGKGDAAGTELHRLLINTTVGVLGFGDPARDEYGLEPVEEDLGQTLAKHGMDNGFYIVLPLLGPSTVRDLVGRVGDLFLNPVFYVEPVEAAISISAVKFTNENSFHIGEYEAFRSAALDAYVAMREIYIQYRSKQIQE